jgi:hypothetical protein
MRGGTPFAWDRYSFAHAQVLVDRTGIVSALVEEKGRIAAVRRGLAVIFALVGRIKPYPVALAHELRAYPLQTFPMTGDDLLQLIAAIVEHGNAIALQQLFIGVLDHARSRGHGDVIDSWGSDIAWMQTAPGSHGAAPRSSRNSGRC